jgi:hypothetical protein
LPQLAHIRKRVFRRNFSSRARELSGGDVIVISIPKSGRTWVRTFLAAYYCKREGLEMTLEPERHGRPNIPRVIYSHDRFEHRTKGNFWDRLRGKYLIPAPELDRMRIILLVRDPRDAFVSLYVQLTRRTRETPEQLKQQTVSALLRDPRHGVRSMVETMNSWLAELSGRPRFALVKYEALRSDPETQFRMLLAHLGENEPDPMAFAHALGFSEFGNMQKLEAAGAFESKILQAGDVRDPESFKVRRGKVGGFRDYLSPEDQAHAAEAIRALHPDFAYSP